MRKNIILIFTVILFVISLQAEERYLKTGASLVAEFEFKKLSRSSFSVKSYTEVDLEIEKINSLIESHEFIEVESILSKIMGEHYYTEGGLSLFNEVMRVIGNIQYYKGYEKNIKPWYDATHSTFAAAQMGYYWNSAGWNVRGGAWAANVTDEHMSSFMELERKAGGYFNEAIRKSKMNTFAMNGMLNVCKCLGKDHVEYERWFQVAVKAPENLEAYVQKSSYILPRWMGYQLEYGKFILIDLQNAVDGTCKFKILLEAIRLGKPYGVSDFEYYNQPIVVEQIARIINRWKKVWPMSRSCYRSEVKYLLKRKKYYDCINACNEAEKIHPDDYDLIAARARAFVELDKVDEAVVDFKRLIEKDPNGREGYERLADIYYERNQYALANSYYKQAMGCLGEREKKYRKRFHYRIGIGYYFLRNYALSEEHGNLCIKTEPNYSYGYLIRGMARFRLKKIMQAKNDFEAAIRLDPDHREYIDRNFLGWNKGTTGKE